MGGDEGHEGHEACEQGCEGPGLHLLARGLRDRFFSRHFLLVVSLYFVVGSHLLGISCLARGLFGFSFLLNVCCLLFKFLLLRRICGVVTLGCLVECRSDLGLLARELGLSRGLLLLQHLHGLAELAFDGTELLVVCRLSLLFLGISFGDVFLVGSHALGVGFLGSSALLRHLRLKFFHVGSELLRCGLGLSSSSLCCRAFRSSVLGLILGFLLLLMKVVLVLLLLGSLGTRELFGLGGFLSLELGLLLLLGSRGLCSLLLLGGHVLGMLDAFRALDELLLVEASHMVIGTGALLRFEHSLRIELVLAGLGISDTFGAGALATALATRRVGDVFLPCLVHCSIETSSGCSGTSTQGLTLRGEVCLDLAVGAHAGVLCDLPEFHLGMIQSVGVEADSIVVLNTIAGVHDSARSTELGALRHHVQPALHGSLDLCEPGCVLDRSTCSCCVHVVLLLGTSSGCLGENTMRSL